MSHYTPLDNPPTSANRDTEAPQIRGHHTQCEDGMATDFDYSEVERALGETATEPPRARRFREAGDLLEALVVWLAGSATIESAGLRAVALCWTLRPRACDAGSGAQLAKRFGLTRQSVSKYVSDIHKLSRGVFTTGTMRPPADRAARREIAREYHKRAGHRLHAEK
jgi:hypothetical protein